MKNLGTSAFKTMLDNDQNEISLDREAKKILGSGFGHDGFDGVMHLQSLKNKIGGLTKAFRYHKQPFT